MHSTDGGISWNHQLFGELSHLESIYFVNSEVGWAVGYAGTILKTTNGGINWFHNLVTQLSGFSRYTL
ncbi:MAG: hypothetical protein IPJ23_18450 [Ignavibacteriales bacterium]|nr:hypothetical protein [Ignavibacteriales bacterium]